jgi:hypothetical protein
VSADPGSAYPGAFVLSDDGSPNNPLAIMVVPLPSQLGARATLPPRLTAAVAVTHRREYPGCAGAEGVIPELLQYCAEHARDYRARVSWILWGDASACLLIRTSTSMTLRRADFERCYGVARGCAEAACATR